METVIIVGAGLGGLTAGALLAKQGFKVTVLEQHAIVGGCATTFRRGHFRCETSLHEMDNLYKDPIKREIFESLGVYDYVKFVQTDEFFRLKTDHIDFTMPHDRDQAIEKLNYYYPNEAKAIQKYFDLIRLVAESFYTLQKLTWWQYLTSIPAILTVLRYKNCSVKRMMDTLFTNEEVKLILNANVSYYHNKISDFSFLMHCVAQDSYYQGGSWYIFGGSQILSDYLASIIQKHGGEIITKAQVVELQSHKKRIHSVKYRHHNNHYTITSDYVISNIAPQMVYRLANIDYKETNEVSTSYCVIYIGFSINLKKHYGKKAYSQFYVHADTIDDYDVLNEKKITDRGFVFVDYSQINSGLCFEENSFGAICVTDSLVDWEHLDEQVYQYRKKEVFEHFIDRLETEYPDIRNYILFSEVGTPRTIKRYIKTPEGTANGFAPTAKQFFKIPQIRSSRLSNLFCTGSWVLSGGFSPSIISGKMCSDAIVKKNNFG